MCCLMRRWAADGEPSVPAAAIGTQPAHWNRYRPDGKKISLLGAVSYVSTKDIARSTTTLTLGSATAGSTTTSCLRHFLRAVSRLHASNGSLPNLKLLPGSPLVRRDQRNEFMVCSMANRASLWRIPADYARTRCFSSRPKDHARDLDAFQGFIGSERIAFPTNSRDLSRCVHVAPGSRAFARSLVSISRIDVSARMAFSSSRTSRPPVRLCNVV